MVDRGGLGQDQQALDAGVDQAVGQGSPALEVIGQAGAGRQAQALGDAGAAEVEVDQERVAAADGGRR